LDTHHTPSPDLTVDGIAVNVHSLPEGVSSIVDAAEHGDNFSVCTLNLDHVEKLRHHPAFLSAYRRARFVTADGFPIVALSRLLGTHIDRTTGADLVEPVCREAGKKRLPVFMLGSNESTLQAASQRLRDQYEGLDVVGCLAPRCLDELTGTGVLCIGAALDFIAGTQTRAPAFSQKYGLEWAWRMLQNPRRLGPRYARCLGTVPQLVARSIPQIFDARIRKAA
jgi:N-acetylglucosaminyldiphosphoundecaprenol N-acetyl-beta-D-mannosaminyltransferase